MTALNLEAISAEFLNQCGPCDFGIDSTGCNCSKRDFRPAMLDLVREVERLRRVEHAYSEAVAALELTEASGQIGDRQVACWLELLQRDLVAAGVDQ
jgi:hypothetical protein